MPVRPDLRVIGEVRMLPELRGSAVRDAASLAIGEVITMCPIFLLGDLLWPPIGAGCVVGVVPMD